MANILTRRRRRHGILPQHACTFFSFFLGGEDMANWFRKKEGEGEGISRMRLMNMVGGGGLTRIAKQALFPFSVR